MESNNFQLNHQLEKKNIQTEKNENKPKKISTLRSSAPQFIAALAISFLMFNSQAFDGFSTILIAELERENPEIEVSLNELTWIGSQLFMGPVGAILVGLLAQQIGSHSALRIASVIFCISWAMFYFSTNATMLLISQGLCGLFVISAPSVTYIVEISQPHLRSILLAIIISSQGVGSLFTVFIASFLHWRTVAIVNMGLAALGLIVMTLVPNSPHWLTKKGEISKAAKSLAWLRGWLPTENVESELQILREDCEKKSSAAYVNELSKSRIKHIIKPYLSRTFILPLMIVSYLPVIRGLMGVETLQKFSQSIFEKSHVPYARYLTVAFYSVELLGNVSHIAIVKFFGKKRLLNITLVGAALTYLAISVSITLINKGCWPQEYAWITAISILLVAYLNAAGISIIMFVYGGELLPTELCNVGTGITNFLGSVTLSLMNKAFIYIVQWITMPGIFMVFSVVSLIGLVTFHFIIPETDGKSSMEIQEYFRTRKENSYLNFNNKEIKSDGKKVAV